MKPSNCKNCGAVLDYTKAKNNILQCAYCNTQYHIENDSVHGKMISEYVVELEIMGQKRKYYIGEVEAHPILNDFYRDISGKIIRTSCESYKTEIRLIEM